MFPLYFVLTLIVFQVLLVFVHLAAYATLAAAFGFSNMGVRLLFALLALTFTSASILVRFTKNRLAQWYYAASAYWFGLVHFLFGGGVLFFVIEAVAGSSNVYVPTAPLGILTFGAAFLLHLYGTWQSGRAGTTRISVALPNLPAAWKGKKLVFISDSHLGALRRKRFAKKVVRKINVLAPEAVLMGGDFYDGPAADLMGLAAEFKAIKAPKGIYFVSGNHDYFLREPKEGFAALESAGIHILRDEAVTLDGLTLVGADYGTTHKEEGLRAVLARLDKLPEPSIFLKHEPTGLELTEAAGASLALYGHTHHGQIWPLSLITKRIYKGYDYGLRKHGALQVYTSSGVGTWGPPLRLGTRSEIVLIELT